VERYSPEYRGKTEALNTQISVTEPPANQEIDENNQPFSGITAWNGWFV